jgi:Tol biopolymer transport system component/plastocyanin
VATVTAVLVATGLAALLLVRALPRSERARDSGKLIVTRSPDSLAPKGAPAHWLPPEDWVYNHWLPFDEERLYSLLGITRSDLWQQLRDDRRTLAQLAAKHGWPDARRLAAVLVAPQDGKRLERRAERVITQGHLAQHVFFHSLHQFAIPSKAPELFGVSDAQFRTLRRAELSPLTIARLHGRSLGRAEALAIAVLRERVRAGVDSGAMPEAQGRRLLRRQLTQLPRWLGQARYNGPPPTTKGALVAVPKDYASNPAISGDGRHVAYESYRQKLPLAVRFGEIAVMRADLPAGRTALVSPLRDGDPVSHYNPAISADGRRISYETSAGNQNFAKRYGRISVLLTDMGSRRTSPASSPRRAGADAQSDYNPVLAANGRREAFQAVRDGRTAIVVRDLRSGRERIAARGAPAGGARFADVFEPGLSADGTRLVFTVASGRLGKPGEATSEVRVRDLRKRRTTVVGPAHRMADDPAISPDGRWVVFTSYAGRPRLLLHDLATGRTTRLPDGGDQVVDPVVARFGKRVAFTSIQGAHARVKAWTRATGATTLVSRAGGTAGRPGNGDAGDPSISDDGRRVAFASTATNLSPGKADDARAIFVRDLNRASTDLVSDPAAAYPRAALARLLTKAKANGPPAPAAVAVRKRPALEPGEVAVTDNAFFAGTDRPTLRVGVGQKVTWAWRSRQSHNVTLRSGLERFATGARTSNRFSHRFEHPGTYTLFCALHAPGMRMTVVVG